MQLLKAIHENQDGKIRFDGPRPASIWKWQSKSVNSPCRPISFDFSMSAGINSSSKRRKLKMYAVDIEAAQAFWSIGNVGKSLPIKSKAGIGKLQIGNNEKIRFPELWFWPEEAPAARPNSQNSSWRISKHQQYPKSAWKRRHFDAKNIFKSQKQHKNGILRSRHPGPKTNSKTIRPWTNITK